MILQTLPRYYESISLPCPPIPPKHTFTHAHTHTHTHAEIMILQTLPRYYESTSLPCPHTHTHTHTHTHSHTLAHTQRNDITDLAMVLREHQSAMPPTDLRTHRSTNLMSLLSPMSEPAGSLGSTHQFSQVCAPYRVPCHEVAEKHHEVQHEVYHEVQHIGVCVCVFPGCKDVSCTTHLRSLSKKHVPV